MLRTTFPVEPLGCNCTILADADSRQAIVIDPGGEAPRILAQLSRDKLQVVAIVHTHAHIDHVGGTAAIERATQAKAYLHQDDVFLHDILPQQAMLLGIEEPERSPMEGRLQDGMSLAFGKHELGVIHTPGHTPGSVCFVVPGEDVCFSGDTLFAGGIGRTDLWGGDYDTIEHSIKHRLYTLNGAVEVVPGHGPNTRIERERSSNPFVRA